MMILFMVVYCLEMLVGMAQAQDDDITGRIWGLTETTAPNTYKRSLDTQPSRMCSSWPLVATLQSGFKFSYFLSVYFVTILQGTISYNVVEEIFKSLTWFTL